MPDKAARRAVAVIGAGFGDEGKGACVDAIAAHALGRGHAPLVVRASSGAQAAHTVAVDGPDGSRRHVFGHVGAGALAGCLHDGETGRSVVEAGAPTWLGSRFVHNPPLFLRERDALRRLGLDPMVTADPGSVVTLPVDVAINQGLERMRGAGRHGSCGIGFGEAVGRSERAADRVTLALLNEARADGGADLLERLVAISKRSARRRIDATELACGAAGEARDRVLLAATPDFLAAWLEDALSFARAVRAVPAAEAVAGHDLVIFEGAQGLLLDRDAGFFPHVTRSRTGLANVAELVPALGVERLTAVHVTRAYATRHGAGPLPGEGLELGGSPLVFEDATNVPNPYQQQLRFAPLAASLVGGAIAHDLARARAALTIPLDSRLAVTCLDQTDGDALVLRDGAVAAIDANDLPAALGRAAGVAGSDLRTWMARGPARRDRDDPEWFDALIG